MFLTMIQFLSEISSFIVFRCEYPESDKCINCTHFPRANINMVVIRAFVQIITKPNINVRLILMKLFSTIAGYLRGCQP